jgi:hypothetical protein
MRTRTVSAFCFSVSLICSPLPVAAQSNPPSPSMPQTSPQKAAGPARLVELPKDSETGSAPLGIDSTNGPTNPSQSWNLLAQQNRSNVDQLWSFKKGILPQTEATRCGHIVIFRAPNMDSEMIQDVPQEFSSDMPSFEGLPPCFRDSRTAMVFRDLRRLVPIPPSAPFVAPARIQPTLNPRIRLNSPQP